MTKMQAGNTRVQMDQQRHISKEFRTKPAVFTLHVESLLNIFFMVSDFLSENHHLSSKFIRFSKAKLMNLLI